MAARNKKTLMQVLLILALAFIFNAINAVYYYSFYSVSAGIAVIIVALALFMLNIPEKNGSGIVYAAIAFAEAIILVPDLSFQYVKALYISPAYAAIVSVIIVIAPLCAYFYTYKNRTNQHRALDGEKRGIRYMVITSVLFGLLSLYSLAFYSNNIYLNDQAFIGSVLFMSEGILLMMTAISMLL